jgi:hypothetical protein
LIEIRSRDARFADGSNLEVLQQIQTLADFLDVASAQPFAACRPAVTGASVSVTDAVAYKPKENRNGSVWQEGKKQGQTGVT